MICACVCICTWMRLGCLDSVLFVLHNILIKPQALGRIKLGESAQIVIASANGGDLESNQKLNQVRLIFCHCKILFLVSRFTQEYPENWNWGEAINIMLFRC